MWEVMFWPIMACVLLPWLLVYLGLHVVQRGIIFIDIAMAQMASLGICVAVLLQFEPESLMASVIGLAVTLIGAAVFSATGKRASQVPQEAIIGIAYVVAAAAAILLLSRSPHGNEEIRNMLVGDITVVSAPEVWKCFGLFAAVGTADHAGLDDARSALAGLQDRVAGDVQTGVDAQDARRGGHRNGSELCSGVHIQLSSAFRRRRCTFPGPPP